MFNKHVFKDLSAYCHGELSVERSQKVAEHLLQCERCRKDYEDIKLGIHLSEKLPRVSAPDSIWPEIEGLLPARSPGLADRRRGGWLSPVLASYPLAIAAFVLLTAAAIGAWYFLLSPKGEGPRIVDLPVPHDSTPSPDTQAGDGDATHKEPPAVKFDPRQPVIAIAWNVERLDGAPRVGTAPISDTGRLAVGEWLETDGSSRAKINVGEIGHVEVDPNTRIQLKRATSREHRLALARGRMQALINAPPRLFFVDTPSAVAIDYGCAYTLEVDDDGASILNVSMGWVALVLKGRESIVPAGGSCVTRPGIGPGTPYFDDASEEFLNALTRFDFQKGGAQALSTILAEARDRDTLTLWHLLARVPKADRVLVFERMAALVPLPDGVTRPGILRLNQKMLDLWKEELQWVW